MSIEQRFIDAIRETPGDNLPMLVYADWLDEQGNDLGELIRIELEMRQSSGGRFQRLREQADYLRVALDLLPRIEMCPECSNRSNEYICQFCREKRYWFHSIEEVVLGTAKSGVKKCEELIRYRHNMLQSPWDAYRGGIRLS